MVDNGTLPLATVLGPESALAADGFVMYRGMHDAIASSAPKLRRFARGCIRSSRRSAARPLHPRLPIILISSSRLPKAVITGCFIRLSLRSAAVSRLIPGFRSYSVAAFLM